MNYRTTETVQAKAASDTQNLSKEESKAAKKVRQQQNKLDKLKPLKSHEKRIKDKEDFLAARNDEATSGFVFEDPEHSPSPKHKGSKPFPPSPGASPLFTPGGLSSLLNSKRPSSSPAEDVERKLRSRSENTNL